MASLASPSVPVSWGELLDKMTILEIKRERIAAASARDNVAREYAALEDHGRAALRGTAVTQLFGDLRRINEELWEIEDAIRAEEDRQDFGATFVALARSVYHKNDQRAAIKRRINQALESDLVEEKSYWSAAGPGRSPSATSASTPSSSVSVVTEPGAQGSSHKRS